MSVSFLKPTSSERFFIRISKRPDKPKILPIIRSFQKLGFQVNATAGTADYLMEGGVKVKKINKVSQGSPILLKS